MKVSMVAQPVTIYTVHHRIDGEMPLPEYGRLSDRLNQGREFIPITRAAVSTLTGERLFALDVLMVNKAYVVMVHEGAGAPAPAPGR